MRCLAGIGFSIMEIQDYIVRTTIALSFFLMSATPFACAQTMPASSIWVNTGDANVFEMDIPFDFRVGEVVFEPGPYRFSVEDSHSQLSIRHKQYEMKTNVIDVISQLGGPTRVEDPTLVFDNFERYPVLSEVWIPGSVGLLVHTVPVGHTLETVIGRGFDKLSGKEAFERTCRRCHGKGGQGDADADKFFKKTLPRLNSESVQGKSDAELKAIISQGRGDMPPVRLDTPGVGHLFPMKSLDELIVYLRTLKK
jgi:hypothetical protein